jgi:CDP-diacylglycerol--glycerol-3-phosphate 3-phosphatidyltransferase
VAHLGVTADQITCLGVVLAFAAGAMIARGDFWVSVVLLTVGGLMDTLDGVVAKAAGTASKKGAFLDSVADRVSDAAIFGGVAWYLASGSHPRTAVLPFAILGVSMIISYQRAKAESLGYNAKGGLMERAERLIFLGVALLLHVVLVPLLWVLLALSAITAVQRFVKVWGEASRDVPASSPARLAWGPGRVESRWRAWREARADGTRRRATRPDRVRSRRREIPLGVRLRGVLVSERSSAERRAARNRPGRASRPAGRQRPRRNG